MGFWDGNGIRWTICKQFAPRSRQITTPTPHQSIFTGLMPNSVKALNNHTVKNMVCTVICQQKAVATQKPSNEELCLRLRPAVAGWHQP